MRHKLVVAVLLVSAACGGANTSDPVSACRSLVSVECKKGFQCDPTGAARLFGTESACESQLDTACTSANLGCPSGKSYSSGNASKCIDDVNAQSCTAAAGGLPTSCSSTNLCT